MDQRITMPESGSRGRTWRNLGRVAAVTSLVALATAGAGLGASAASAGAGRDGLAPVLGAAPAGAAAALSNSYVVVLHGQPAATGAGAAAATDAAIDRARSAGVKVARQYHSVLNGFSARLTAKQLAALRADPAVDYIAHDGIASAVGTQSPTPSWGLDRVDQHSLPLNGAYSYPVDGTGVTAFVIDTGIRTTHADFGGRASSGYDAILDGNGTNDCNGHGTHVAGTIGGTSYGVAKKVNLVAVRVLDCTGHGPWSGIIAGMDWVATHHSGPAVANMSLSGGFYQPVDDAVTRLVSSGVTLAVAASNNNADACGYSPASSPQALTVGATDDTDTRASFSNYGSCVDLFAPGVNITSSSNSSDTATAVLSGTSMASPHAAGAAALYLQEHPTSMPWVVDAAMVGTATPNKVIDPAGSPNLLLYSRNTYPEQAPPAPVVTAQYKNFDSTTGDSTAKPGIRLVNTSGAAIPLSSVKVRYWFTRDGGSSTYSTYCDYSILGCANVTRSIVNLATPKTGADAYLEVGFTSGAGNLAAGGTPAGDTQLRFNKSDWSNLTETNDYSYLAASSAWANTTKVTVYVNGTLVSGTEP